MVKSPKGDAVVPVKVVTQGDEGGPYDVVILACKAYDLDSAIASIAPAVGPDTTIVPMLNGHAHFATLDARFGAARVAGGLARISGMLGPNGEILHSGASGVSFGERDGKPAAAFAGGARRGLQEGRHRRRPQSRHQPGPLGQVGDAGHDRLDVRGHARHASATSSRPRTARR